MKPRVINKRLATIEELAEAVYVGRPSKWGNPFSHLPGTAAQWQVNSREQAIELYRQWILGKVGMVEMIRRELRGKHLVCWCAPLPCHANVLLEIANAKEKK